MNFAQDPLSSYFDECQKNEIHLLYLHYLRNNFHQLKSSENEIIINNDLEVFAGSVGQLRKNSRCVVACQ